MRYLIGVLIVLGGCGGTMVEPGHLGLVFDSKDGLHHEVLAPGFHRIGRSAKVIDYDVTYSTRIEPMKLITIEGLPVEVKLAVLYRPVSSELYQLETETGPRYYDEVLGPELRGVVREEVAKQSYIELMHGGEKLEDPIERAVRDRIAGKHVELESVTLQTITLAPEVVTAIRARVTAEQNAQRAKLELESAALRDKLDADEKWQKEKVELEHEVERRQLQGQCRSSVVSK